MNPDEFIAKTEFGKFRVKINGRLISVGGKRFCTQIAYKNESDVELTSLETRHGLCEINNKEIQGELTVHMVHLAFTILKTQYPNAKIVNLIDTSSFVCEDRPMGLMKTSLLLYGKTYYQRRFNAQPLFEEDALTVNKFYNNWINSKLPENFSFNNDALAEILLPIYKTCATWAEFATKLNKKFGRKVCKYIYPWFLHAIVNILRNGLTEFWKIDITDKSNVAYERLPITGGNRRTLKKIQYQAIYRPAWDGHDIADIRY